MAARGGSVLEPGWLLSPAGRPYLDSILQKNQRRVFGLLERPVLPPHLAAPTVTYKLFLSGKSGVGKTALVATLAGTPVPPGHHETLGIEATTVYWPAKLRASGRPVIFQLHFWDCGDGALKKFEHLLPSCKEEADAILFLFSFTDRSSFEELPAQMSRVIGPDEENLVRVVVGTKFDLSPQADVTEGDVVAFEGTWGLPVLRASSGPGAGGGPGGAGPGRPAPRRPGGEALAAGPNRRRRRPGGRRVPPSLNPLLWGGFCGAPAVPGTPHRGLWVPPAINQRCPSTPVMGGGEWEGGKKVLFDQKSTFFHKKDPWVPRLV